MPVESDEYRVLTETGLYKEKPYREEKELERLVVENARAVFGDETIYFDTAQSPRQTATENNGRLAP